ncbi:signal peptidase II [Pelagibacterium lentulum]|uniref:Lipoprotein signal peptidase n=1 Tax=Pelagibacterium lentulum TaxID=2029865 RepID=A0A916RH35_9HYPH|nr:signal peptidase II [Pelagibacterium lentulum]GGA56391.1 lipoprotein signal peptidase [Pelagibacterium lentulum]
MKFWAKASVRWSVILLLAAFVVDRVHKYIQVDMIGWTGGEVIPVLPFFDYVLVWNTGISYGLLGGMAPEVLLVIMAIAMIALAVWWWKDDSLLTRLGIALAIGGALSNAVDRVVYTAVADFFHFYAGTWSFYIFNIADIAISLGVALLIFDVFWPRKTKTNPS